MEWNPSRWYEPDYDFLLRSLDKLLLSGYGYEAFCLSDELKGASVVRLHVAADIDGVDMKRYVWTHKKDERRKLYLIDGLETIYTGPLNSADQKKAHFFCVYDKAKEAGLSGITTRVEARYNYPKLKGHPLKLCDLPEVKNLFLELHCTDILTAFQAAHFPATHYREGFAALFADRGIDAGLRFITEGEGGENPRKKLATAIEAATPPFWNPDALWTQLPARFAGVFPGLLPADK